MVRRCPSVLGVVIVGIEVGFIYAYRAGLGVSVAAMVQSSFLAVALLFLGRAVGQCRSMPITRNECAVRKEALVPWEAASHVDAPRLTKGST